MILFLITLNLEKQRTLLAKNSINRTLKYEFYLYYLFCSRLGK